jgi:hypothetical protein
MGLDQGFVGHNNYLFRETPPIPDGWGFPPSSSSATVLDLNSFDTVFSHHGDSAFDSHEMRIQVSDTIPSEITPSLTSNRSQLGNLSDASSHSSPTTVHISQDETVGSGKPPKKPPNKQCTYINSETLEQCVNRAYKEMCHAHNRPEGGSDFCVTKGCIGRIYQAGITHCRKCREDLDSPDIRRRKAHQAKLRRNLRARRREETGSKASILNVSVQL